MRYEDENIWLTQKMMADVGTITAEIAKAKAETEFEKYRLIQDRLFKADFDRYLLELDDQSVVEKIKRLRNGKLEAIRAVWDRLPKATVQGDISINNLVYGEDELTVFDYNNSGDEILVSDLVMEGLLTAYEMDIPEGADPNCREQLFPALVKGYLSLRDLSEEEADVAWLIYTLYHSLWFTRIVYNEDSLEKLVERRDYLSANRLLDQMLLDMTEDNDGRFKKGHKKQ